MRHSPNLPRKAILCCVAGCTLATSILVGAEWQPLPDGPVERIAFGSCAKHWQPQPIWDAIIEKEPDLFLFLGDNIYADTDGVTAWQVSKGQLTGEWNRPGAIAVDALGNVYLLDQKSRSIEVLGPHGTKLDRLGPTLPGGVELKAPRDIAIDGEGRLYIADVKLAQIVVLE